MKKIYVTLLIALVSATWLGAQEPSGNFAQPQNITGRKINASGEVTKEYAASFDYLSDGKLNGFLFSEWDVSSSYSYENDFLSSVYTQHNGMWPYYSEIFRYTYEDGQLKTEVHESSNMGSSSHFEYEYDADGRLYKKYYANDDPEDYYAYSVYEYEDNGKNRIESYTARTFWGTSLVWLLGYRTTYHYSDSYALLSEQTDKYNAYGAITLSKRILYSYTPEGKIEMEVSQTLVEDNWENNTIHKYIYGDEGLVVEQQFGTWSDELADWNINKKIIHEYSEEPFAYTVTFYKKSGDGWVYDTFNDQMVFFMSELTWQQKALTYFVYEELFGSALINQFEFEMIYTKTPTYMSAKENEQVKCGVYPNPGKENVTISAPVENSVIRFYDSQGRMLLAKPFDFNTTVGTDDWAPGMYLWEIWNGTQKEASGKWVKE